MKKLLIIVVSALMVFTMIPSFSFSAELQFTDVPEDAWYYQDVEKTYESGLFRGVSSSSFEPNGLLRINQAVTLAARVSQFLESGTVTLKNGSDEWYSTYVDYAKKQRIIGNEYDGRWNEFATRAEMVEVFSAIPQIDCKEINSVESNAIPDVSIYSPYAESVYKFYRAGILTGRDGNRFDGSSNIIRCEVATILSRLIYPNQRQSITLKKKQGPDKSESLTDENLLKLLDVYDPDGAWLIRETENIGVSWRSWVGGVVLGDLNNTLNMAIHEKTHDFNIRDDEMGRTESGKYGYIVENIYIGNGKFIKVNFTKVFDSLEMARTIPEDLRTSRYYIYIAEDTEYLLTARQLGIYGLMDEFSAYCWGVNNQLKMLDFFGNNMNHYSSDYISYSEFRYYILHYLLYAKDNHPDIYQGIIQNEPFRQAFTAIDNKFAMIVKEYKKAKGLDEMFDFGGFIFKDPDDIINDEISKEEYQDMLRILKS